MDTINNISQGTKFIDDGKIYMKLPEFTSCYGHDSNAIDLHTGTMVYFNPDKLIQVIKNF